MDSAVLSVLISSHDQTSDVAKVIFDALEKQKISCLIEDSSLGNTHVRKSKILLVLMSDYYESNLTCRSVVDCARQLNKHLVPVCGVENWSPQSWLKMLLSGRECFRVFSLEQAYEANYDQSTEINNLVTSVIKLLHPTTIEADKEKDLTYVLKRNIEKCKSKLCNWPPKKRSQERQAGVDEKPVFVEINEMNASVPLNNTREILRLKSAQAIGLTDIYAIYSTRRYDCVLLYETSVITLVMQVNADLNARNLSTWVDLSFSQHLGKYNTRLG